MNDYTKKPKSDYGISNFDLSGFEQYAKENNDSLEEGLDFSSREQQTMIYSLFSQLGVDKKDFGIEKISKLTKAEATDLIEQLMQMKEDQDESEFEEEFFDYYGPIGEDLKFGSN